MIASICPRQITLHTGNPRQCPRPIFFSDNFFPTKSLFLEFFLRLTFVSDCIQQLNRHISTTEQPIKYPKNVNLVRIYIQETNLSYAVPSNK